MRDTNERLLDLASRLKQVLNAEPLAAAALLRDLIEETFALEHV